MKKITKICPVCSITFEVPTCHQARYKTCGYECGGIYRSKPIIENTCKNCNKIFIAKKSHRKKQDYCSGNCSRLSNKTGKILICITCKNEFYCPENLLLKRKYCNNDCRIKDWNKKSLQAQMPGSYKENAWKTYEKKCYDCGLTDSRILVIHHIDGNRKNGKLENLIPVCHNCHCIRHIELSGNHRLPSYRGSD